MLDFSSWRLVAARLEKPFRHLPELFAKQDFREYVMIGTADVFYLRRNRGDILSDILDVQPVSFSGLETHL